jgi:hypothetical protein
VVNFEVMTVYFVGSGKDEDNEVGVKDKLELIVKKGGSKDEDSSS